MRSDPGGVILHFLLDEHVSPDVAPPLRNLRPSVLVTPMQQWRDGEYLGVQDDLLLAAACEEHLTLVTYDRRTIVPLLIRLAASETPHGGVILVDEQTVGPADIGGLARSLALLWDALSADDWTDRVVYLTR